MQHLLKDPRVDPSDKKNDALVKAACMGHKRAVQLLVTDSRIYLDGKIPYISKEQSQLYYNSSEVATRLIRETVLRLLAGGEIPFDVYETFSPQTLSAADVTAALQSSNDSSLLVIQEAKFALQNLSQDIVTEILWITPSEQNL